MNKNRIHFLISFCIFFSMIFNTSALTTRQIGDPPKIENIILTKWLLFYANVERINRGVPYLIVNNNINLACGWQADYMGKTEKLIHVSSLRNKHDVHERLITAGEKTTDVTEFIEFSYLFEVDGKESFKILNDDKGYYADFGVNNTKWLNEREIARNLIKKILSDPDNEKYFFFEKYNSVGCGFSFGKFDKMQSCYCCMAFIEKKGIPVFEVKTVSHTEIKNVIKNNKEVEESVVVFDFFCKAVKLDVLLLKEDGSYTILKTQNNNNTTTLIIDSALKNTIHQKDVLYLSYYDKGYDMYYPISKIDYQIGK